MEKRWVEMLVIRQLMIVHVHPKCFMAGGGVHRVHRVEARQNG
jgi:hypothetical protein